MTKHSGIEIYPAFAMSDERTECGLFIESVSNMWNANCIIAYFFDPPSEDTIEKMLKIPGVEYLEDDMFIFWHPFKVHSVQHMAYRKEVKHVPLYPFPKFSILLKPTEEFAKTHHINKDLPLNAGSSAALRDYVRRGLLKVIGVSQIIPFASRPSTDSFVAPVPEDNLTRAWGGKMLAFRQIKVDIRDKESEKIPYVHVTNVEHNRIAQFITTAYSEKNVK